MEQITGVNEVVLSQDREIPLLMDDILFAITANGSLTSIEGFKGVLEVGDSQVKKAVLCRGKNPKIRLCTRKLGTTNALALGVLWGGEIPDEHRAAILKRLTFINVHEVTTPLLVRWISALLCQTVLGLSFSSKAIASRRVSAGHFM